MGPTLALLATKFDGLGRLTEAKVLEQAREILHFKFGEKFQSLR